MVKYLVDIVYMIVIWVALLYFIYIGEISMGEFLIGALLAYIGARFLFIIDFICEILEERVETTIERIDE